MQRLTGRAWQRIRRDVMERDDFLCVECIKHGTLKPGTEVDHIKPLHKGGDDSLNNLQLLCRECHNSKTLADTDRAASGQCDVYGNPIDKRHHWNR